MRESYNFTPSIDGRVFDFVTIGQDDGKQIETKKQVLFEPEVITVGKVSFSVTNMALVDVFDDGSYSDTARSGNGNMVRIFNTVANCLIEFLKLYPNEVVRFTGSDELRTRLYRNQLSNSNNYEKAIQYFDLYGVSEQKGIFLYEPNRQCDAFLIRLKK